MEERVEGKRRWDGDRTVEEWRKEPDEGGVKGRRKHGGGEVAEGWTKEQELALRMAYFTAKPSPHFWKNVAKLVCFLSLSLCKCKIELLEEELILSKS
jgi:hypothetical protein